MVERTFSRERYNEFAGLSTDEKPTVGVGTGSLFFEVDTKKIYAFNGTSWVEQMTLGA